MPDAYRKKIVALLPPREEGNCVLFGYCLKLSLFVAVLFALDRHNDACRCSYRKQRTCRREARSYRAGAAGTGFLELVYLGLKVCDVLGGNVGFGSLESVELSLQILDVVGRCDAFLQRVYLSLKVFERELGAGLFDLAAGIGNYHRERGGCRFGGAAAAALAGLVSDEELCEDFIMPDPFDPRIVDVVSKAVKDHIAD